MAITFRMIGITDGFEMNPQAAENVVYFAREVQKTEDMEQIRWNIEMMHVNLDDIIRTIELRIRLDVNGHKIDKRIWRNEVRDLIEVTKMVSQHLKSFRY